MKERIFVFDFDGVIADSLDITWRYYKKNYVSYGLPEFKKIEEFTDLYDENFFKSLLKLGISPFHLRKLARDLIFIVGEQYRRIKIFPGMKKVLARLGDKHKIIIISSNYNRPVKLFLARYRIEVDRIIGADEEKSKVRKIKRVIREFPKAQVFYIGDTMGDIVEGRQAGAKTVGVSWGFHSKQKMKRARPDFLANKSSDLLKLLKYR